MLGLAGVRVGVIGTGMGSGSALELVLMGRGVGATLGGINPVVYVVDISSKNEKRCEKHKSVSLFRFSVVLFSLFMG